MINPGLLYKQAKELFDGFDRTKIRLSLNYNVTKTFIKERCHRKFFKKQILIAPSSLKLLKYLIRTGFQGKAKEKVSINLEEHKDHFPFYQYLRSQPRIYQLLHKILRGDHIFKKYIKKYHSKRYPGAVSLEYEIYCHKEWQACWIQSIYNLITSIRSHDVIKLYICRHSHVWFKFYSRTFCCVLKSEASLVEFIQPDRIIKTIKIIKNR